MVTKSATQPTPLHRETALARESHRHDLLDPATLRWVASLLTELDGVPSRAIASHLLDIAETAGSELEVHWKRAPTKRSVAHGRTGAVATEAGRRASG